MSTGTIEAPTTAVVDYAEEALPVMVLATQVTADKDNAAHIVQVPGDQPDETPQAYAMRARVEGFPITALCGYVWTPNKDPQSLPVCMECKAIFDNTVTGDDKNVPED